ncbi:ferritin family protein [bacterium]|nr:ferritin family protein [bacterium]
MAVFFSGDEIIQMAVKTEETGYAFYQHAAQNAKSDKLKDLFNYLAGAELRHKEIYLGLMGLIEEHPQGVPIDWDELGLYIKAMTDSSFFVGGNKNINMASKAADDKEAIDFALAFEKDTILFFYQLKDLLRTKDKPIVEKVIQEEKEHIRQLSEMKKAL